MQHSTASITHNHVALRKGLERWDPQKKSIKSKSINKRVQWECLQPVVLASNNSSFLAVVQATQDKRFITSLWLCWMNHWVSRNSCQASWKEKTCLKSTLFSGFVFFFYNVKMSSGLNATAATAATANSRLTRLTRRVRLTATFFVHSGALWGFHGWQEETSLVAIKRRLIKFLSWLHWMAVLCSEYVCSCVYVRVRGSECANIRQHPPAAFGVQQGVWTNVVLRPTRSRSN